MRILVVGQVFYPDSFRINDIVKELAKTHEVKMVTGLPDYDLGRIPDEFRLFRRRSENYYGAKVIRVPIISRRKGPVFRSLNYISYMITGSIYTYFLKEKYDVVFSFQTSPITMFVPGLVYAKKNKVKSVLYTLDLWPESVKAMKIKEDSRPFKLIHNLSRLIYDKADIVLTSSPSFKDYLKTVIGLSENLIHYLPQYTDEKPATKEEVYSNKVNSPIVFTFAGNIGLMQDVETIVKAVELIKGENFVVHIAGSGSNEAHIRALISEKNLDKYFKFQGRLNHEEMDNVYENTDVCLLTLSDEGFIGKTIPGKLQTYMAKGKAIAGAISHDTKKIIEESKSGLCAESGDFTGLADHMQFLIRNPEKIREYGLNSYNYYMKKFTREQFIKKLTDYLEEVTTDV